MLVKPGQESQRSECSLIVWTRSGPRTKEPKLDGRRVGNGGAKESDVVRITL